MPYAYFNYLCSFVNSEQNFLIPFVKITFFYCLSCKFNISAEIKGAQFVSIGLTIIRKGTQQPKIIQNKTTLSLSSFYQCYLRCIMLVNQYLWAPSSPPGLSGVHVTRYLVLCVMFCRSLFVLFLLAIVLSVLLRFTDSDYLLVSVWLTILHIRIVLIENGQQNHDCRN